MVTINNDYVQYGAGYSAPAGWLNFDASPTLRIQKIPLVGARIARLKNPSPFPTDVIFGDIVRGLPVSEQSVSGLYASHVLEHLSLADCRIALKNSFKILKPGGIFRLIVPSLTERAAKYLRLVEEGNPEASHLFMHETYLGVSKSRQGLKDLILGAIGNADHLWMWDNYSMSAELSNAGFTSIRPAKFGDCEDLMFSRVECFDRFIDGGMVEVAIEARRPQ